MKTQARMEIYEGLKVQTVIQKGSDGQKMAVKLFDVNNDGMLDKAEANLMNRCNFTVDKNANTLTIYENREEGKKTTTVIKFDDTSVFTKGVYSDGFKHFCDVKSLSKGLYEALEMRMQGSYDHLSIDLKTDNVKLFGATGEFTVEGADATVINSDLEDIYVKDSNLDLKNVKDRGVFFDTDTEVHNDGSKINYDANSKIDIEED